MSATAAAAARTAPSVSPLSNASRTKASSPIATRDVTMREVATDDDPMDSEDAAHPTAAHGPELSDDRSSSLSEPEDDEEELEHHNGIEVDGDEAQHSSAPELNEADSEAETELVTQTPRTHHKSKGQDGKTPTKLSQAAAVDDELSDPPSPLPDGPEAASSTSTGATGGKKRKRSETAESSLSSAGSDIGQSPPKRAPVDPALDADEAIEESEQAGDAVNTVAEETPIPDETPLMAKATRGRKPKAQKGRKAKAPVPEPEIEVTESVAEAEEEGNGEIDANTEEMKQKKEASALFGDVAKQFRAFRERLTNERLASLTAEIQMLSQPICEHPEYLRQVACVDARREKQRKEAFAYHKYRKRCIRDRTLGERSQLHSQFFQQVRQYREDALDSLGESWYAIQKERRQEGQENDDAYIYKLPEKRSMQVRQQAKYNQEVSVLSGIAKHVGFPAAPEMTGVQGEALESDLKAMKIAKQSQAEIAPPMYLGKAASSQTLAQSEKLAHDQFMEQNAWARPQASVPSYGTPGISHTPDWAEPSYNDSSRGLMRNLSAQQLHRASSPYATPMAQRRLPGELSSTGGPSDFPSSVVAAPPTMDRMAAQQHHHHHGGSNSITDHQASSPILMQKHRQTTTNHGDRNSSHDNNLPSIRNISNISGASTIDAPPDQTPSSDPADIPNGSGNGNSKPAGFFSSFSSGTGQRAPPTLSGGAPAVDDKARHHPYSATASFRPHSQSNHHHHHHHHNPTTTHHHHHHHHHHAPGGAGASVGAGNSYGAGGAGNHSAGAGASDADASPPTHAEMQNPPIPAAALNA